ncbi:UDP-glucose dehydrogenase family protein [Niallia sp. Krafla_26]|uniref:UDP-glucose dehydrogenase family protein n=1 Tax=Niallia sp. Krafla_26 TaxID=3064703 RepID=UPI003D170855
MKVTVAGTGYVGLVTGVCLADLGHHVTCMDVQEEKINLLKAGYSPIYETGLEPILQKNIANGRLHFTTNPKEAYAQNDLIFITVGTPENPDGTADLQYVERVALTIAGQLEDDVIVCMKSTVPVGTTEKVQKIIEQNKPPHLAVEVVSNPEFLREGSAVEDFYYGDRIVIGSRNQEAAATLEELYSPLQIPMIKTDIRSAEMIKYASNAFLATKISFINEISTLCEKIGANIDEVASGIGSDRRIGPHFLQAGIGYGGSCFPKDTKALAQLAGNVQHPFELLEAVIKVNNRQQSLPVEKAKHLLGSLQGLKVAVLGIAFKPKTDDIREAASIKIITELLNEGAIVTAYDPVAIPNAEKVFGEKVMFTDEIREAILHADLAIIATEWDQIKMFPLYLYSEYMNDALIIDGRNCYSLAQAKRHEIKYISIGRPVEQGDGSPVSLN